MPLILVAVVVVQELYDARTQLVVLAHQVVHLPLELLNYLPPALLSAASEKSREVGKIIIKTELMIGYFLNILEIIFLPQQRNVGPKRDFLKGAVCFF